MPKAKMAGRSDRPIAASSRRVARVFECVSDCGFDQDSVEYYLNVLHVALCRDSMCCIACVLQVALHVATLRCCAAMLRCMLRCMFDYTCHAIRKRHFCSTKKSSVSHASPLHRARSIGHFTLPTLQLTEIRLTYLQATSDRAAMYAAEHQARLATKRATPQRSSLDWRTRGMRSEAKVSEANEQSRFIANLGKPAALHLDKV